MDCPNCRSQVLDTWLYCPRCGHPSPTAAHTADGPSPTALNVSPGELLESMPTGFLFITQRRRIGQVNAAARALFGINANQYPLGKPYEEFIRNPECVEILRRILDEANRPAPDEAKEPDEFSLNDAKDQENIYQIHSSHLRNAANALVGTTFVIQDITDLRIAERMKTEFVSIVSHELSTPLTPMKGFIRTLIEDEKEEWYTLSDRREFYNIIDENVDRLRRLVNDLLNVSHIERMGVDTGIEMNWEMVALRKATEEALDTQRGRTDKHTFIIDFEPEDITFQADFDKLKSILQNFVSNAIKYTDGGEIRVIARLKPADDEFAYDAVMIGVKDHGMGMEPRFLKKIGQIFHHPPIQSRRHSGDTGLYVVKALIAAHKGVMTVESELGKGTTFWIRLPLCQPTTTETGPA